MNEIKLIENLKKQMEILSYKAESIKNDLKIANLDGGYSEEFINSKKSELITTEEKLFRIRFSVYNKLREQGIKEGILEDLIIYYAERQISTGNNSDYYRSVLEKMDQNYQHIIK